MKSYSPLSSPFLESEHWQREYLEEESSPFSESGGSNETASLLDSPDSRGSRLEEGSTGEHIDEELWSKIYEPFVTADREVGGDLQERESRYGAEKTRFNVRWYQTILKVAGRYSDITVNGNHNDPNTRAAFRNFQKRHELEASGYLTVESNAALTRLAINWIYNTPGGNPTIALRQYIKIFQKGYGLEPDGKVGPITMSTMVDVLTGKLPRPLDFFRPTSARTSRLRRELGQMAEAYESESHEADDLFEGIIVGEDTREVQTNTLASPNRWVGLCSTSDRVEYKIELVKGKFTESGPTSVRPATGGTGCLISPRHVLTAAHLLASIHPDTGNRIEAKKIKFKPAFNGAFSARNVESSPYCAGKTRRQLKLCSTFETTSFEYPEAYEVYPARAGRDDVVVNFDSKHDYALIELTRDVDELAPSWTRTFVHRGKKRTVEVQAPPLGFWGASENYEIRAMTPGALDGREVFTIGYPSEVPKIKVRPKRRWMQWKARGVVDNDLPDRSHWLSTIDLSGERLFYHTADTSNSHSGGPIWIEEGDTKILVGIQLLGVIMTSRHSGPFNIGLALTETALEQIRDWAPQVFRYRNGQLIVK